MEEKKTFIEHETQYLNQKHAERSNRMTFVTESNQTLQQQQLRLQDQQQNVLPKLKEHLMILEARTKQRQKVIVRLLQVIYPITTHGKLNHWLINGLAIYKGYATRYNLQAIVSNWVQMKKQQQHWDMLHIVFASCPNYTRYP